MSPLSDAEVGTSFIDAGPCVLQLIALEDDEGGSFGDQMRWVFHHAVAGVVTADDDGTPHEFWQWSSLTFTPRAKAPKWLAALLNRDIVFDSEAAGWMPTSELVNEAIGKSVNALVIDERGDDGMVRSKIPMDGMSPLKVKKTIRKATAPAPEPEPGSDDEDDDDSPF